MSDDKIQRQMDFIVAQQAKFTVDIQLLQEAQNKLSSDVQVLTTNVQALTSHVQALTSNVQVLTSDAQVLATNVQALTINVQTLTTGFQSLAADVLTLTKIVRDGFNETREAFIRVQAQADADRAETREYNEVTRKLAEEVAHLAAQTSRRVTLLEGRQ